LPAYVLEAKSYSITSVAKTRSVRYRPTPPLGPWGRRKGYRGSADELTGITVKGTALPKNRNQAATSRRPRLRRLNMNPPLGCRD
jgi:hypothetical protein